MVDCSSAEFFHISTLIYFFFSQIDHNIKGIGFLPATKDCLFTNAFCFSNNFSWASSSTIFYSGIFAIWIGVWFYQSKLPNFLKHFKTVAWLWIPYCFLTWVMEVFPVSAPLQSEVLRTYYNLVDYVYITYIIFHSNGFLCSAISELDKAINKKGALFFAPFLYFIINFKLFTTN